MNPADPIALITYLCVDGIWRTRCEAHQPATGPYAPDRSRQERRWNGHRRQCIACWMQARVQPEDQP